MKLITLPGTSRSGQDVIPREVRDQAEEFSGHLLLDFTNVEFICSVGLGVVVGLHKKLKASGGRLTLCNLKPQVLEVFEITRLNRFLEIHREPVQSVA